MQDILEYAGTTMMDIYVDETEELEKVELINFEDYFNAQKKKQIAVNGMERGEV